MVVAHMNLRHNKIIRTHKKALIISASIVIVIIILGVITFLLAQATNTTARQSVVDTKVTVQAATKALNVTLQDNTVSAADKTKAIAGYSDSLSASADDVCRDQFATVYFVLTLEHGHCQRVKTSLQTVKTSLAALQICLKDQASLAAVLPATGGLTSQQSYDAWVAAVAAIDAVSVDQSQESLKMTLKDAAAAHRDAWKAVIDADVAHNEANFLSAKDAVSTTYAALKKSADSLPELVTAKTTEFSRVYADFLSQSDPL